MVCLTLCYFRDVPGVEVLMEQHQTRKVEIDAREDSFQNVVKMGKDLIARNHYATPEVKNNVYFSAFTPIVSHIRRKWEENAKWLKLVIKPE